MTLTVPATVAEADVALLVARDFLLAALTFPWDDEPVQHAHECWRRVDQLLERRLELQRAALDREIEQWWVASWPGDRWPVWPPRIGQAVSSS